jgi:hypothetical protein
LLSFSFGQAHTVFVGGTDPPPPEPTMTANVYQIDRHTFHIWVVGESTHRPQFFSTAAKARAWARQQGFAI